MSDNQARQDVAMQLDTTFFVEAAAGTGKTTALVARLLNAVKLKRARLHEIVAITFTEKAAGELKDRLRRELVKNLAGDDLRQALADLERAPIATIHSFCASILRERPVEAKVDPQFAVADALQRQLLLDEAWSGWLTAELTKNPAALRQALMREVSIDNLKALAELLVEHRTRLAWPAAMPVSLRTTRQHLQDAVPALERSLQHNIAKSEAFYQRVQALIDALPQLEHASAERAAALLSALELTEPRKKAEFDSQAAFDEAKQTVKDLKPVLEEFRTAAEHNFLVELAGRLAGFATHFQETKRAKAVLDFDDLLEKVRDLFRDDPETRRQFQQRYKFVLVDEFQDTDPIQSEIVLALGGDVPGKLFIVGDPKQSIYGFRRADIEMYAGTRRAMEKTGRVVQFQQNFRSQSTIIDWVNATFRQLIQRVGDYQSDYIPLFATRQTTEPRVVLLQPKTIVKQSIDEARRAEAAGIAQYLHRQVAGGSHWRDVALLFRSFTGVEAFANVFNEAGVPFRIIGGRGYYQRQEIQTLISLLCCLDNPNDKLNLVAVLRSPLFGWSDEQIFLANEAGGLSYLSGGNVTFDLLRELHEVRHQLSIAGFVELVLARTHVSQAFFTCGPDGQASVANLLKALELARQVEAAGIRSLRGFVRQLRRTIIAGMDEEPAPSNEEADDVVQLLTMHKSKGLEFPIVVIADLAGKSSDSGARLVTNRSSPACELRFAGCRTVGFDDANAAQDERDKAEEIRLLYVAATRARERLVIPCFAEKGERLDLLRCGFTGLVVEEPGEPVPADSKAPASRRTPNEWIAERRSWQAERAVLLARVSAPVVRTSPSKLAAEAEPVEDEHVGILREQAMDLGVRVHAALERMDAAGLPDDAREMVENALKSDLFKRVGEAEEVHRELPFTVGTMEGKIDLLFREKDRWVLVDYKTDKTPEPERYRVQLQAYREALKKVAGIEVAEVLLFFLVTGQVVKL